MAELKTQRRNKLPDSDFAVVRGSGDSKVRKYPIDTMGRARNALARVSQFGSTEEKVMVARAVARRYPELARNSEFIRKTLGRKRD